MSQLVVETDAIKKGALYFFGIVGVLAIVSMIITGAVSHFSTQQAQTTVPAAASSATASASTSASTTQQYPYVIEFTVLSTTAANGYYEAVATSGQIFKLPDFSSWNSLWPQDTYTATIIGTEADGVLDVGTINRLSVPITFSALTGGVQTSQYYAVIEFTVLSTTLVNGNYEVLTTDGRILYLADYNSWRGMVPREAYSGTVIGREANGVYDIGTVNLISTANYYQRVVYLGDVHSPVYNPPVYNPPVNHPPVYNPPVYNPPLNRPTQWVGL